MNMYKRFYIVLILTLLATVYISPITYAGNNGPDRHSSLGQPPERPPITADNADQVTQLAMLGRGYVNVVALSPDGNSLAVGSSVGVWLYDTSDLEAPPILLPDHQSSVISLAYSPDGSILASGSAWSPKADPTVRLWDAKTGAELQVFRLSQSAADIEFSPDGALVAVAEGFKNVIWRWSVADGSLVSTTQIPDAEELKTLGYAPEGRTIAEDLKTLAYSPDGLTVAAGGSGKIIYIIDIETGEVRQVLAGHENTITGLAFSTDGQILVSGSEDTSIRLWDTSVYGELARIEDVHRVRGVTLSYAGDFVVSWDQEGVVRLWDTTAQETVVTLNADAMSAALSRDGHMLATASNDHTISLWSVSEDDHDVSLNQQIAPPGDATTDMEAVAFSPDGRILVSCGTWGGVRLWDSATYEYIALLNFSANVEHCAYSPSGAVIAVASDTSIIMIDAESGAELGRLTGHTDKLYQVAFNPDGTILASAGKDTTIRLWDVASGTQIAVLEGHTAEITSLVFSPDGTLLVSGGGKYGDSESDFSIRVWDVATATQAAVLEGHIGQIFSLAFSPDGKYLASNAMYPDQSVRLWNMDTHSQERLIMNGIETGLTAKLAFSPNGEILAMATSTQYMPHLIQLWETQTWTPVADLSTQTQGELRIAFSPDGTLLASTGDDATVRVWGIASSTE